MNLNLTALEIWTIIAIMGFFLPAVFGFVTGIMQGIRTRQKYLAWASALFGIGGLLIFSMPPEINTITFIAMLICMAALNAIWVRYALWCIVQRYMPENLKKSAWITVASTGCLYALSVYTSLQFVIHFP